MMREITWRRQPPIASTPTRWLGRKGAGDYADELGFCASANLEEIEKHGFVLTPDRSCGSAVKEDDGEPFEVRFPELVATLEKQFAEGAELQERIQIQIQKVANDDK